MMGWILFAAAWCLVWLWWRNFNSKFLSFGGAIDMKDGDKVVALDESEIKSWTDENIYDYLKEKEIGEILNVTVQNKDGQTSTILLERCGFPYITPFQVVTPGIYHASY